jgi:hypothetical protein
MPTPTGPQFRQVVHLSNSADPPHTVDHPHYKRKLDDPLRETSAATQGVRDRINFANSVVFAADHADVGSMRDSVYLGNRKYVHNYSVPTQAMSVELFGDDDLDPEQNIWAGGDEPELWQGVQATREDAATNNRVVRFVNAGETHGKTSYILPKSMITSGDIRYEGTTTVDPGDS